MYTQDPRIFKHKIMVILLCLSFTVSSSLGDSSRLLPEDPQAERETIEIFAEAKDKFFLKVADVQITFKRTMPAK